MPFATADARVCPLFSKKLDHHRTPTRNQTVLAAVTGATARAMPSRGLRAGAVRALSPSASGIAMIFADQLFMARAVHIEELLCSGIRLG